MQSVKEMVKNEFVLFLSLGMLAAGVNFFSRIIYSQFFDFGVAVVIAYVTGMVVAFLLFRSFVFGCSGKGYYREIRDFIIVNLLGIFLVWFVSVSLAEYVFPVVNYHIYPEETAHAIGIAVPAISSYFGHKYLTFKFKK